jgi:hypothetical protein
MFMVPLLARTTDIGAGQHAYCNVHLGKSGNSLSCVIFEPQVKLAGLDLKNSIAIPLNCDGKIG